MITSRDTKDDRAMLGSCARALGTLGYGSTEGLFGVPGVPFCSALGAFTEGSGCPFLGSGCSEVP